MTYRFVTPTLLGRIALLGIVWSFFAATDGNYRTFDNLYAMLEGFALLGLVATGIAVTMIAGELDLSVGSVAAVSGILAVKMSSLGLVPCILLATLIAATFGAAQGLVIARTGINSLVFTIATLIGIRGVAHVLAASSELLPLSRISMADDITHRLWILSPFSIIAGLGLLLVGLFLAFLPWGREIYAMGGGRAEASAAGVSRTRPLTIAFAISAACAGMTGALASVKSASATPFAYESLLLAAVTAALVGGISLYGGRGTMFGVLIGVLTLRFLISGFASRGAPIYIESLATGLLLLGVLGVEFFTESPQVREWRERRASRQAGRAAAEA